MSAADVFSGSTVVRRGILSGAGVCVILVAWYSLTRTLYLSPDSFVYLDTAQSLAGGHGLSHSVLHVHELGSGMGDLFHASDVTYAPLYPIAVAALLRAGVNAPSAALLVAASFYGITLAGMYLLCRRLYGAPTAVLVTAVLLHYLPLYSVGVCAWSESLALACLVFGFLALAGKPGTEGSPARGFLAGLCLGLAFAARYALLPAAGLGLAVVAVRAHQFRRAACATTAYMAGAFLGAGPPLLRNYLVCGRLLGAERPASERGLLENVYDLYIAAFQSYLPATWLTADTQARLLVAALVLAAGVMVLRKRTHVVFGAVRTDLRWMLPGWALFYLAFLVIYRTLYMFDQIGPRLALPGLLFLIPPLAAMAVAAFQASNRTVMIMAAVFTALAVFHAAYALATTPRDSISARVANSERLTWVLENTNAEDIIIGDMLIDLPAYCGPRRCLSFFPLEDPKYHLTSDGLVAFLKPRLGHFEKAFIVLRRIAYTEPAYERVWQRCCGHFIADLVYDRPLDRPGIHRAATLKDGQVFEVDAARFVIGE